jgi:hypothetical protein
METSRNDAAEVIARSKKTIQENIAMQDIRRRLGISVAAQKPSPISPAQFHRAQDGRKA